MSPSFLVSRPPVYPLFNRYDFLFPIGRIRATMATMRKNFPVFGAVVGLALLFACSPAPETPRRTETSLQAPEGTTMPISGRFIHVVFFWFKENAGGQAARQVMDDAEKLLGSIETVRYLAVGPPAGTPREVVDNSYDVALVVHFDDEAGHDVYQDAEAHQRFIDRNLDFWERVQVYDFVAE
jgi:hypothetical protein